jgi:hypothetical protein
MRRSENTERVMQIAFQRYREGGVGVRTVISETKGLKISQPGFAKAYKKWLSQQMPLKSTSVGEKISQSAWGENLARVSKLVVAERAKVQGKRKSAADIVKEESTIASLRTDTVNKHIQKGSLLPPPPGEEEKKKGEGRGESLPTPLSPPLVSLYSCLAPNFPSPPQFDRYSRSKATVILQGPYFVSTRRISHIGHCSWRVR